MKRFFFPWRVYRQMVLNQLIWLVLILLIVTGFLAINNWTNIQLLVQFSFLVLLLGIVATITYSYFYCRPLGRVLLKARRLSGKGMKGIDLEEDEEEDEIGEFSDLQIYLNRIRKRLKKRKDLIAQEEEELTAIMNSVNDSILAIDRSEHVLFCNARFLTSFGCHEIHGKQLTDLLRNPQITEMFFAALNEGKSNYKQIQIDEADRGCRYFSLSVAPLYHRNREIYGAVGIFHDMTELLATEKMRIDFVANASHELRTPLTSIKGYVETLQEDLREGHFEQVDKFLGIVNRNIRQMTELVEDLLVLSRLDERLELKKEKISTLTLSQAVIDQLSPQINDKNQIVKLECQATHVWGLPTQIERLLTNLLTNAIKFVQSGGEITIKWQLVDKPNRKVGVEQGVVNQSEIKLTVKDNGPGLAAKHLSRIFERFYRVDGGRSRGNGGTGLGLAIVKHIMLNHDGRVTVESAEGAGTEFCCYFPQGE